MLGVRGDQARHVLPRHAASPYFDLMLSVLHEPSPDPFHLFQKSAFQYVPHVCDVINLQGSLTVSEILLKTLAEEK